jgi:uncharacterized membrane protein (Fun14 family)
MIDKFNHDFGQGVITGFIIGYVLTILITLIYQQEVR